MAREGRYLTALPGIEAPDSQYLRIVQFGLRFVLTANDRFGMSSGAMRLASGHALRMIPRPRPSFAGHIRHVVGSGAQKQMSRIDAPAVSEIAQGVVLITGMAYEEAIGNRAMGKFVGETVSVVERAMVSEGAVACWNAAACPQPASIGTLLIHFRPEPLFQRKPLESAVVATDETAPRANELTTTTKARILRLHGEPPNQVTRAGPRLLQQCGGFLVALIIAHEPVHFQPRGNWWWQKWGSNADRYVAALVWAHQLLDEE